MLPDADDIADCVLDTFDKLPEKRKPRARRGGEKEWIPLAGIVLVKNGEPTCVSLGTGMKCLPSSKLALAQGNVMHDWHAEVLAIRAFNRFLLDQLHALLTHPHQPSQFIRHRVNEEITASHFQPFTINEDVKIFMYCSEAPCGDSSMELTMNLQEDATPWTSPAPIISIPLDHQHQNQFQNGELETEELNSELEEEEITGLRGRSHFSHLGALRYKPSRPDAPPTLSKSCTDKLTIKQGTSILSSLASLLISPQNAYISTLILPTSQHVPSACERAFSRTGTGRMKHVTHEVERAWMGGGYMWNGFNVKETSREFTWCRRAVGTGEKAVSCNMSAVWTPGWQETLIGGVLQGRKQFDVRGASAISRRGMWKMAVSVAAVTGVPVLREVLGRKTYAEVKGCELLDERRRVKRDIKRAALKGWVKNDGDEEFSIESTLRP